MRFNTFAIFADPSKFPWDIAEIPYPTYGHPHSYACKAVARFASDQESFLLGNPSMFELRRYGDEHNGLANEIYYFFKRETLEDSNPKLVLRFLQHCNPFVTWFENRLKTLLLNGTIELPQDWFYQERSFDEWDYGSYSKM